MMHFEGPFLTGTNPELDAQCRAIYWGTRLWLYSFAVLHKPRWLERKPLLLTYQPPKIMWMLDEARRLPCVHSYFYTLPARVLLRPQ